MKEWEIQYLDKDGDIERMTFEWPNQPSIEEAADKVRKLLFPVAAELDVADYQGKSDAPTAKSLQEQNAVHIIKINEVS